MKHPHIYRAVRCHWCDKLMGYFCRVCHRMEIFRPFLTFGIVKGVCAGCTKKISDLPERAA